MFELMKAVAARDEAKVVELLSEKGTKLDEADAHGNTPLNYACAMGLSEDINLKMISLGADCKIPNKNGAMPLNHAVYSRRECDFAVPLPPLATGVN
jgi:ankyrin repeat protein